MDLGVSIFYCFSTIYTSFSFKWWQLCVLHQIKSICLVNLWPKETNVLICKHVITKQSTLDCSEWAAVTFVPLRRTAPRFLEKKKKKYLSKLFSQLKLQRGFQTMILFGFTENTVNQQFLDSRIPAARFKNLKIISGFQWPSMKKQSILRLHYDYTMFSDKIGLISSIMQKFIAVKSLLTLK